MPVSVQHPNLCLTYIVCVDYLYKIAFITNLNSVLIKLQIECTAAVNRGLSVAFSVQHLPTRNVSLYNYTTKKKRLTAWREHPENLNWAKSLLDLKKSDETSEQTAEEPHMLHVVYLIKTLKGRPWWEKDAIRKLGFDADSTRKYVSMTV